MKPILARRHAADLDATALSRVLPQIQSLIDASRQHVVSTANLTLVWLYWNVGRIVTEDIQKNQKRADYGQRLIEQLSARLARDYGRGFSAPNLWDMKRFFEGFEVLQAAPGESAMAPILQTVSRESAKADILPAVTTGSVESLIRQTPSSKSSPAKILSTVSRESSADSIRQAPSGKSSERIQIDFTEHYRIGWSHYRILLSLEAGLKRQFYFDQSAQQRWSVRELSRQIDRALFERVALSRDTGALVRLEKQRGPVETVRYEDAFKDFKPFAGRMTKIGGRKIDKSYEIYLALYQAVSGTEEIRNTYKQFSPDFFDLVIVDECHRGSADEDSAWREILTYFSSATQIGLTATPRETRNISNIDYFGDPIFTYSLKQGIADGFLAPYKVVRVDLDKDINGWRPKPGQRDRYGQFIEDRLYNQLDMDRSLVLDERTKTVAWRITQFLKATDRFAKTIVFCDDIDHAERMRQALILWNGDEVVKNHKYVMRITGDDTVGKAELDTFILPEAKYPVIVTTSRLLNTGVDVRTCKLIVLDQRIESMTTFKQIIGRGTRILEDYGKTWFTIMDFKGATRLFADPDFDGDPVQIYEPDPDDPPTPPIEGDTDEGPIIPDPVPPGRSKYYVDKEPVKIIRERTQFLGADGQLSTESVKDYTRKTVRKKFALFDDFLNTWSKAEQKRAIVHELEEMGVPLDALEETVGRDYDPFDLICHVAYDEPPLTRRERADRVRKRNYFARYGDKARAIMEALLEKYADQGIESVESPDALKIIPFPTIGTPVEIVMAFGGRNQFQSAMRDFKNQLYASV